MGKTSARVPRQTAAALRSTARLTAQSGATVISSGTSALRDRAAPVASALSSNTAKQRQHVKATATIAKATARGVVSGASEQVKTHVGNLARSHGKTVSMEQLAALAEQLSWSADVLHECLQAFDGNMADAAQHMATQISIRDREDQLVTVSVVQAAFSGPGDLGLQLAPGASGGAVVIEVKQGSLAWGKPQLVPGLALIEVQGHTVQGVALKQVNDLLRTAGRPLQLRFQSCSYFGDQVSQWFRVLSRSRLYCGSTSSATTCGFLEVGELVCVKAEPSGQSAAASPSINGKEDCVSAQTKSSERVPVRRQRGPRVGWVSLSNDSGKVMLQSVNKLSKLGKYCSSAQDGSDDAVDIGSLDGVSNGKHCTEAERLFSIELLQGRFQDDALALTASTSARMNALRELIDSKEAELLREIRRAADDHCDQLQQTKKLCSSSRRIELPASALDADRFLADLDGCLHQVSGLSVVKPSATQVSSRHTSGISHMTASASSASELPRDLRQLSETRATGTPVRKPTKRVFRRSASEHKHGTSTNSRFAEGVNGSTAGDAPTMDASYDLTGELSESPSPSAARNNANRQSTPQQAEHGSALVSPNPAKGTLDQAKAVGGARVETNGAAQQGRRLINLPIASGSAGATRKIATPSKKRRMDAFRKSSSGAINV